MPLKAEADSATASSPRSRIALWALLAGLVAVAVHARAARNGFTNWDDTAYLHNNPHIVAPDGLARIWTTGESPQYYPLTFTSFWIEHKLWGFHPLGYHLVNVTLHGVNAALVVLMLSALGMTAPAAFIVALFFAISPIQVMSVAWVAERKNTLSTVFGLLSLIACWRWARNPRPTAYVAALVTFVLALASKTAWVVLPLISLAGWRLVFRLRWRRAMFASLPFIVLSGAAAVVTWKMETLFTPDTRPGALERLLIASGSLLSYIRHTVAPIGLYPYYPKWNVSPHHAAAWLPLVVLLGIAAILIAFRRRIPAVATWGIIAFVAFLLPILGFVPFSNMDLTWVSDHFAYDAVIGLYAAGVVLIGAVLQRISTSRTAAIGTALTIILAVPCAALTWQQIPIWKNATSMWSRAAEKNPKSPVPFAGLAAAHIDAGDLEAAVNDYERLLELDPHDAHARAQLGWALVQLGRLDHVDARLHLGSDAESRGDLISAIAEYRRAIELDPTDVVASSALAGVLIRTHQFDEAGQTVDRALAAHPDAPALLQRKGAILDARGRPEAAELLFRKALAEAPDDAELHYAIGAALARQGRRPEAIESYQHAIDINPDVARYWNNLGATLLDDKQPDAAISRIQTALKLDPQDAVAWNNLGAALAQVGRYDDAVDALERAVDIAPQYANARHRLGKTLADAGRFAEAAQSLNDSIRALGPAAAAGLMNELARLLAACPDASVRDPAKALAIAEQVNAQTGGQSWEALDTLAIAQAAAGQLDRAAETAARAVELARAAGASTTLGDIERRVDAFKRGEPYVGR